MTVPILLTERCVLSAVSLADRADFDGLYSDENVRRYLGGVVSSDKLAMKFEGVLHDVQGSYWIVRLKNDGQLVGLISSGNHHDGDGVEISYEIATTMQGQGLGVEAVRRVMDYVFEDLGIEKLLAETQARNVSSIKLLQKLGMILEYQVERYGELQSVYMVASN